MGKKFALVAVSVTAGLVTLAPVASAAGTASAPASSSSAVSSVGGTNNSCTAQRGPNGSTRSTGQCSNFGKNNGQGNTFNGRPVANPFSSFFR